MSGGRCVGNRLIREMPHSADLSLSDISSTGPSCRRFLSFEYLFRQLFSHSRRPFLTCVVESDAQIEPVLRQVTHSQSSITLTPRSFWNVFFETIRVPYWHLRRSTSHRYHLLSQITAVSLSSSDRSTGEGHSLSFGFCTRRPAWFITTTDMRNITRSVRRAGCIQEEKVAQMSRAQRDLSDLSPNRMQETW